MRSLEHRPPGWIWVLFGIIGAVAAGAGWITRSGDPIDDADIGELSESRSQVGYDEIADATAMWGLASRPANEATGDTMAGGLALDDLDGDGDLDLVIAQGTVAIYRWAGSGYADPVAVDDISDAATVSTADVDRDGFKDLLIGQSGDEDSIVFGAFWNETGAFTATRVGVESNGPTAGLIAAELTGDDLIDIVQLQRDPSSPDQLLVAVMTPREFQRTSIGGDGRRSLAAEIVDVDGDGLLDVWVTRDVGWDSGRDSLYSRRGVATGQLVDIGAEYGTDLAIDGMGVTIADLNGDAMLDAYVSDLGDNEVLIRRGNRFESASGTGAAHIRPISASENVVSSSWSSGALDLNLDGHLDLVVANGGFIDGNVRNKVPHTEVALADPPAVLLGDGAGSFTSVTPDLAFGWDATTRAMTIGDVDGDGDDDVLFLSIVGTVIAWENTNPQPSVSVTVDARCPTVGASVEVRHERGSYTALVAGHAFNSTHAPGVAIGSSGPIDVTVTWPDGTPTRQTTTAPRADDTSLDIPRTSLFVSC